MQRNLSVTVLGRSYPLRVDEQHEGFTRRIAEMVDERVQQIAADAPGHPPLTHMVLAALSLGEEVLTLREELSGAHDFQKEADELAARLERALENGDRRPNAGGSSRKGKAPRANPKRRRAVPDTSHSDSAEGPAPATIEGETPAAEA